MLVSSICRKKKKNKAKQVLEEVSHSKTKESSSYLATKEDSKPKDDRTPAQIAYDKIQEKRVSYSTCSCNLLTVVACVAGGLCSVATKGRGTGEMSLFSLFLSLSCAKIQYGTQTDVSPESTRMASYAGYYS